MANLRSLTTGERIQTGGGKQYKNVYTILEKVKKGEIPTHYKQGDGLFGKINFYKKADLIKPYMHYIDEDRLSSICKTHVTNQSEVNKFYNKFAQSAKFKRLDEDKKPDWPSFNKKLQDTYRSIPAHLKNDIYKMYYSKIEKLEFEDRDDKNYTKYKFLEKSNNPVGKIMAESSALKSAIFTRNMMLYYSMQLTMMEYVDKEDADKIGKGLGGSSDFDNQGIDEALDKMMNNQLSKNMMDDMLKDAQDTCKSIDESIDKETQQQMFDEAHKSGGKEAGNLSPDYIRTVSQRLNKLKMSMGSVKERIKKLLDKSASYFSSRKETIYEDIFNSDNIAGLEEYEFLHPKLRKVMVDDIVVKDTKSVGKLDLYIDVSGSMSGSSGIKDEDNNDISCIDFAKSFAVKLAEMDMLNEVYVFNNSVKKYKSDTISLAMLDCNGGTTINEAVKKVVSNDRNAIILTDAEDHCNIYSERVFFIGVQGARFDSFQKETIKKYSDASQVIIFNGSTIKKVDANGNTV